MKSSGLLIVRFVSGFGVEGFDCEGEGEGVKSDTPRLMNDCILAVYIGVCYNYIVALPNHSLILCPNPPGGIIIYISSSLN